MPAATALKIRLAIVNDYEIVVAGVRAMLGESREVRLVDLDDRALYTGSVDVVLYDNFAQRWRDDSHLEALVERSKAKVVVFTWSFDKPSIDRAFAAGASGYLSKGLTAAEIVTALEAIHRGKKVTSEACIRTDGDLSAGGWPGQDQGLTARESEILALITQGLSNEHIAAAVYLSINSVKTYIRTAYRKIGVSNRAQAVAWGFRNGFISTDDTGL